MNPLLIDLLFHHKLSLNISLNIVRLNIQSFNGFTMFLLAAIIVLSYLVGSIPTSIIVSKISKGIDIRDYGSGNAGGTNVAGPPCYFA